MTHRKRISLTQYLVEQQREHGRIPAQLRLLHEANPMAFIVEQAGGLATNGSERIMDIVPTSLHQRVGVVLGAKNEVLRVGTYHAEAAAGAAAAAGSAT